MKEYFEYGSVRGASGSGCPYREFSTFVVAPAAESHRSTAKLIKENKK